MNYDFALFGVTALQANVQALKTSATLKLTHNPPPTTRHSSTTCSSSALILENDDDDASNLDHLLVSFNEMKRIIEFEESESFQAKYDC